MSKILLPLPTTTGLGGGFSPHAQLAIIRGSIRDTEQRTADLEALLSSLILGEPLEGGELISGVNNQDENRVRQELYEARAFEGLLRTEESFWNQIANNNKDATSKTADLAKGSG